MYVCMTRECITDRSQNNQVPLGGVRGFRWGCFSGCYVTNSAPHKILKLIMWGNSTFDERVVLHRVASRPCTTRTCVSMCWWFSSSLLLSRLELSHTQSLWALNTSPPRNRCTFLWCVGHKWRTHQSLEHGWGHRPCTALRCQPQCFAKVNPPHRLST